MSSDIVDLLRRIGLCAPREALLALLTHATKSRLSPAEVVEQVVALERRERDTRNLVARTKRATLGAMKPDAANGTSDDTLEHIPPLVVNGEDHDACAKAAGDDKPRVEVDDAAELMATLEAEADEEHEDAVDG